MKIENTHSLPKEVSSRHNLVNRRLRKLWKDNDEFQVKFGGIFEFHKSKLNKVLGSRVNHDDFFDSYFEYITDLFYQGYYLGRELIENPDVLIADRFYEQPDGIIKEQTFDILSGAAGNLIELLSHEDNLDYERTLYQENKAVEPILLQIKTDVATLGAFQALMDERSTKELSVVPEPENYKGLLHRVDDLFFVDPQKYFICTFVNGNSEVWDLNLWQTVPTRSRKIGEAHISIFEPETTNEMVEVLPFYQGYEGLKKEGKTIILNLSLTERVEEREQLPIVARLVEAVKNRLEVEYDDVHVSLTVTDRIYNYKYNPIQTDEEE